MLILPQIIAVTMNNVSANKVSMLKTQGQCGQGLPINLITKSHQLTVVNQAHIVY